MQRTVQGFGMGVTILLLAATSLQAQAQGISKGHRILLERGIQSQGLTNKNNPFSISTMLAIQKRTVTLVSATPLTRSSHHAGEDFARLKTARLAQASA